MAGSWKKTLNPTLLTTFSALFSARLTALWAVGWFLRYVILFPFRWVVYSWLFLILFYVWNCCIWLSSDDYFSFECLFLLCWLVDSCLMIVSWLLLFIDSVYWLLSADCFLLIVIWWLFSDDCFLMIVMWWLLSDEDDDDNCFLFTGLSWRCLPLAFS